jgi:hypothetical protein
MGTCKIFLGKVFENIFTNFESYYVKKVFSGFCDNFAGSYLFVGSVQEFVLLVFDGPDQLPELLQGSGDPDLVVSLKKDRALDYKLAHFILEAKNYRNNTARLTFNILGQDEVQGPML